MEYSVNSDFFDHEIKTILENGTVQIEGGGPIAFKTDQRYPNVIFTTIQGETVPIAVRFNGNGEIILALRGYEYPLHVRSPRDEFFLKLLKKTAGGGSGAVKLKAPMPGLIKSVFVQNGDTCVKGDRLCILEAMKMENEIKAPQSGVIAQLSVSAGDTVDKNALLCTIESAQQS